MKKNNKWYVAIGISALGLLVYVSYILTNNGEGVKNNRLEISSPVESHQNAKDTSLPIPPLLEDKNPKEGQAEFDLNVQYGKTEFMEGQPADTLGYNGNYLGPVIRVNKGDSVKINVDNQLDEPTTVHWHGLEVPAEMDGGPHQVIEPHTNWNPSFTIDQPAATLWYHPHVLHKTGEQVYKGLAGLFYIEDEFSKELKIPKEYGVDDIPLIVQDKRFAENGSIPYEPNMRDLMDGFMGDTTLINGVVSPELDVKNGMIRLRLLNGSNARSYDFAFSDGLSFHQIASDGGFLEKSVEMDILSLAPAERAEILVDFSGFKTGEKVVLKDEDHPLMTINITEDCTEKNKIPEDLVDIPKFNKEDIIRSREFVMSGMGPMVTINGKQMDMNRIDEELTLNELEEWSVTNESTGMGMMNDTPHSFHVHGVQFQVIERNGEAPSLNEQGRKDTIMLESGEEVKILVFFRKKGIFMYHCHILEHEDSGMMGQFSVQ